MFVDESAKSNVSFTYGSACDVPTRGRSWNKVFLLCPSEEVAGFHRLASLCLSKHEQPLQLKFHSEPMQTKDSAREKKKLDLCTYFEPPILEAKKRMDLKLLPVVRLHGLLSDHDRKDRQMRLLDSGSVKLHHRIYVTQEDARGLTSELSWSLYPRSHTSDLAAATSARLHLTSTSKMANTETNSDLLVNITVHFSSNDGGPDSVLFIRNIQGVTQNAPRSDVPLLINIEGPPSNCTQIEVHVCTAPLGLIATLPVVVVVVVVAVLLCAWAYDYLVGTASLGRVATKSLHLAVGLPCLAGCIS